MQTVKRYTRCVRGVGLALGATILAPTAYAQDQELLVRAVGQPPSKELVAALAETALPRSMRAAEHPEFASLTFGQIAERLCGDLQEGYIEALAKMNPASTVNVTSVAGAGAFAVKWPACFELRRNVSYKVSKDDNPTSIRLHLTGEFADGPELDKFFEPAGINPRKSALQTGQTLKLPFKTLKTRVFVSPAQAALLRATLLRIGGRRVQVEQPIARGSLIGPARGGTTLAGNDECVSDTDDRYPFNPVEVANAYNELLEEQNTVYVSVIDNGFFGVPCTAARCPSTLASAADYSPRFPKPFFARPSVYKAYGANLGIEHILGPINYPDLTPADVNDVSGHGTHVAGLVLGGPAYESYRSPLIDSASGRGRLALSIIAVSRGTLDLDTQTEMRIGPAIDAMVSPMVVNMSIAFAEQDAANTFRDILTKNPKTLFVAAAGNDGEDLKERRIYPASLGGEERLNLITVGSVDSNGLLSNFSNFGANVDLAAPGCNITSWIDGEGPKVSISGTSQAAPLVTFAAALLLSKSPASMPRAIKNRLIYSGDLIRDKASRAKVWSGVRLAIPKALFVNDDFVFVREGGKYAAYLGKIERFGGVTCASNDRSFDDIRSLKRISASEVQVFTATKSGPVSVCSGKLADATVADPNVEVIIRFSPRVRLQGASAIQADATTPRSFRARDLVELIRSTPND